MITTKQLADLCGVSIATVDRALRNRGRIAPATQKKVLRAAKEHGYLPNPAVREILERKSSLIGAVVPIFNGPTAMDLMQTISEHLADAGYQTLLATARSADEMHEHLRHFAARRFAAGMVLPGPGVSRINDSINLRLISIAHPCRGKQVSSLVPDETDALHQALEHLAGLGHRRILFHHMSPAGSAMPRNSERMQAFTKHCQSMQLEGCISRAVHADKQWTPQSPFEIDKETLRRDIAAHKPTALLCVSATKAMSIIDSLKASNLNVPEDLSVFSLGNSPFLVRLRPDISSLILPVHAMAEQIPNWLTGKRKRFQKPRYELHTGRSTAAANTNPAGIQEKHT